MTSPVIDPARLGRELALRHGETSDQAMVDERLTLLQVAESPRAGDWTLRSALVRFAQSQPELAGAILESVRRTHGALDASARELLRHVAITDRQLAVSPVDAGSPSADGPTLAPISHPRPDARTTDVARLVRSLESTEGDEVVDDVIAGYNAAAASAGQELTSAEQHAVPLLVVLLELDELAEVLVAWAPLAPADPPVADAQRLGRVAFERLAALGVDRERQRPRP